MLEIWAICDAGKPIRFLGFAISAEKAIQFEREYNNTYPFESLNHGKTMKDDDGNAIWIN